MFVRPPFSIAMMALIGVICSPKLLMPKTEVHETQVFSKWHAFQQKYYDRDLSSFANKLNDSFLPTFQKHYETNLVALKPLTPFLSLLSNNLISNDGFSFQAPINKEFKENIEFIYRTAESDMPNFITCMARNGFLSPELNTQEQTVHFNSTIEKYKAFARLLFAEEDSLLENENLFAFANRLFEYCYSEPTFQHYQALMTTPDFYPVARFINTTLWYNLVGDGWKMWHANTLDALKKDSEMGNTIKYIAGGTDIYQLLREGIYNINVIDPFLPTQERYYSEGWDFLVEGEEKQPGLGDEIRFGPECNSIKMKRVEVSYGDTFTTKMSNNSILNIKKSITTWHVFDRSNKKIGTIVFHRRPVIQSDLETQKDATLLASYDELIYMALPDMLHGWGIDPTRLPHDFKMYTKQLRNPVGKENMLNIRTISMINFADLRFINLASDPT